MDVGILLAAGRSSRFGTENKLLAPCRGQPLVGHAAAALAGLHRVAVVGDPAVAAVLDGFALVDAPPLALQSDSLRAGVMAARAMGASRVLVLLGDMPNVGSDLAKAVLEACDTRPACAFDGARRMPPAAFPPAWFDRLLALSGDRGAGALLGDAVCVPATPAMLADVDYPGDLP